MQLHFSMWLYLTITEMRGDIGTQMIQSNGFTPEMWGCGFEVGDFGLKFGMLGWREILSHESPWT